MGIKYINQIKVYHVDTDCYGVVWHGAYLRWFEEGRVEFANLAGANLNLLEQSGVQLPVVEANIRYKSPARLYDEIIIETSLEELKKTSIVFKHVISNKNTGANIATGLITCVTTNTEGKLLRRMPEVVLEKFEQALEQEATSLL